MKKKLFSAILAVALGATSLGTAMPTISAEETTETESAYSVGDVNMDGVINLCDTTPMYQYLKDEVEFTEEQLILADVDCDGRVDIYDMLELSEAIMGLCLLEGEIEQDVSGESEYTSASVDVRGVMVEQGATEATVDFRYDGIESALGCYFTVYYPPELEVISCNGALIYDERGDHCEAIYVGETGSEFGSITFGLSGMESEGSVYDIDVDVHGIIGADGKAIGSVSGGFNGEITITEPYVEPTIVQGDLSGNGEIDLYDAIEVAKSVMGMRELTAEEENIADFNKDGVVDLYDVIAIAIEIMS